MQKIRKITLAASVVLLGLTACKKDVKDSSPDEISETTISQIRTLGFNTDKIQKIEEGYLVEGDIIITDEDLNQKPTSPNLVIAEEEQYRTNNLVNPSKYSTITVTLDNSSNQHQAAFSAALDEAISRFNSENLSIQFRRVSSRANITVSAYYQVSNVLGSAGFPSRKGAPYKLVKMNTYWYGTGTGSTNVNYIATVMAHEMGHCIGFRHTDYMNRSYSCGGSGGNEGASTVGAVHIPGTPSGPDANSWMLACIGDGSNRPFNNNDKTALNYLY